MFEASLITYLKTNATLTGLLAEYPAGQPAIFSSAAPQKTPTDKPYIVFDIDKSSTDNLAAAEFDITMDIYHRSQSGVDIRDVAEQITYTCDRNIINVAGDTDADPRFGQIRLFYEDGREVENSDIKVRHYVLRLYARAGRKKWAAETT